MDKRSKWRIAMLPGDGIGPEVIAQTARTLKALVDTRSALRVKWHCLDWPSHAWYWEHGEMDPPDYLEQLANYDAILLGALGNPGEALRRDRTVLSDADSLAPLLGIRQGFDLWSCERPIRRLKGAKQYLSDARVDDIDMLVIRENSEGGYSGQGGRFAVGTPHEIAIQTSVFTYRGTERILRHSFDRARERAAVRDREGQRREFGPKRLTSQVCLVTKRNAQRFWGDMYTEVFARLAEEYTDVDTHHELVDAACMKFVSLPWRFDVVVASNLHGDILTDLGAVLNGGMGVSPSMNINPSDRSKPPMFEPTHGSAPDIAGQDKADPTAMLLTAAMMLEWMGEEDPAAVEAATRLRNVVAADFAAHVGESRRTSEIGDAVVAGIAGR